ncbi:tRNA dihydrouridine synthase [Ascoidea rubescens DSM 1968]|uniref:tRNA-dihydrouridine(16/17) synthase [NAD(P)(+)] n=1 Tax=Ascoidea rubescens DSM 1968 TaxID=1344418 RepID=A0A1D2VPS7_9ASCO|nr:Dus-domain-containing protein [Ascoidea rubescens DSM 1968]ODV63599.1 Dus-domain-containing protein [Ascoidea rubescens DSM 1968]
MAENFFKKKLTGPDLYQKLGCPKKIVAPMVDQSELAWRILSRKHGADLCYTPMIHARLFSQSPKYRNEMWTEGLDGNPEFDRPLIVQFCANDPTHLVDAAKLLQHQCDAIDLNLGCPQAIAKKGKYGSFLMDDWDIVESLIKALHKNIDVPITAKIRVYKDYEKTLEYAKLILKSGAQFLTVHTRTRVMKGQLTGLADWTIIEKLRRDLPPETILFSNGNILYSEDIDTCLNFTNTNAVMSAEGNLYNPAVFMNHPSHYDLIDIQYPRVDIILRQYYEIVKSLDGKSYSSLKAIRSHFFKLLVSFLPHHTDIRQNISTNTSNMKKLSNSQYLQKWDQIVSDVENAVNSIYSQQNIDQLDQITLLDQKPFGGNYKQIPYWRCQPYFRTVNSLASNKRILNTVQDTPIEKTDNSCQIQNITTQIAA